jgi:hypothetical protein
MKAVHIIAGPEWFGNEHEKWESIPCNDRIEELCL